MRPRGPVLDERTYLECACSSSQDVLRLWLVQWNGDPEPELYLETMWGRPAPWWKRIGYAIAYVFRGDVCRFVVSSEHVFTDESAARAEAVLARFRSLRRKP